MPQQMSQGLLDRQSMPSHRDDISWQIQNYQHLNTNPVAAHMPVPDSFIHYVTKYKSHRNSPRADTTLVSSLSTALSSVYEVCFSFYFSYSSLPALSPHFFISMTDDTYTKHSLKAW